MRSLTVDAKDAEGVSESCGDILGLQFGDGRIDMTISVLTSKCRKLIITVT